ncbi:MAG: Na(+)-translocating NADH-quinone reductase subunit C [Candidatus Caldatribacteriota bacterium]
MSETAGRTLTIAAILCGICSVLVSGAVVVLKPRQLVNADLDFKKNILMSTGLYTPGADINEIFKKVEPAVVDLETGEIVDVDPASFDESKALTDSIPAKLDKAGIKKRARQQVVYFVKNEGKVELIVLHLVGKGLWSTMKGFLTLEADANTVRGFQFYSHGETPGLGGEVDNPAWIAQWKGKKVFDENMQPAIDVLKTKVPEGAPNAEYKIDGISGATLTMVGVEGTFHFWLSEMGYGKFLENFRAQNQVAQAEVSNEN